jgi:hypothetical protein
MAVGVDEIQGVLAARHKRLDLAVRREEYTYLLTPILHCAVCGKQLRGKAGCRADTGPRYTHYHGGCTCGNAGAHEADVLEAEMLGLLDLHFTDNVLADLRQVVMERVQARPENAALQAQIEKVEHQLERLRELYVLGDFARDEYMAARAGKMAELAELERELGGADYPVEAVLTRINRMGDILRDGTRKQQKRAIDLLFDNILLGKLSKIKGVELQDWAQPLFADLVLADFVHPFEYQWLKRDNPFGLLTLS